MGYERRALIEKLKLELEVLEKGGYAPSVREPHREQRVFRDSVSCPNLGTEVKIDPCSSCYLMEFVPREHQEKADACHFIPLNTRGDTTISLLKEHGEEALHAALESWLRETIAQLELDAEVVPNPERSQKVLTNGSGGQRPCILLAPAKLAVKS
jgi:hypothetical protein